MTLWIYICIYSLFAKALISHFFLIKGAPSSKAEAETSVMIKPIPQLLLTGLGWCTGMQQ